jgi:hypothetical protein
MAAASARRLVQRCIKKKSQIKNKANAGTRMAAACGRNLVQTQGKKNQKIK